MAWIAGLPALFAQQAREPHIGYIFPAGGQRGRTFEVIVGGQLLDGARDALVSGSGVRITVVDVYKPLNGKRFAELQEIVAAARKNSSHPAPAAAPAAKPAIAAKPLASGTSAAPVTQPAFPGRPFCFRHHHRSRAATRISGEAPASGTPPLSPWMARMLQNDAEILRQPEFPRATSRSSSIGARGNRPETPAESATRGKRDAPRRNRPGRAGRPVRSAIDHPARLDESPHLLRRSPAGAVRRRRGRRDCGHRNACSRCPSS